MGVRLMEQRPELLEQRCVSGYQSGVEQREQEFGVVDFDVGELIELADLVTDHDTEVPQRVQEGTQEPLPRPPDTTTEQDE